jgi:hypothetical protein
MPQFSFSCACGQEVSKRLTKLVPTECPSCGKLMEQKVPVVQPTFQGSGDMGAKPTGVESIDYNLDRAIAENSKKNWSKITERQEKKIDLLQQVGSRDRFDVGRTLDNDYQIIPEQRKEKMVNAIRLSEQIKKHGKRIS